MEIIQQKQLFNERKGVETMNFFWKNQSCRKSEVVRKTFCKASSFNGTKI